MQRIRISERSIERVNLIALICIILFYSAYTFLFVRHEAGDAAIFYPVVKNTAEGAFMRWNPGAELATGVSSVSYVLFLTPFYLLSPNLEFFPFIVKVVNYTLSIGLLVLLYLFQARFAEKRNLAPAISVAVMGMQLSFIRSAIAGFETPFYFCILVACIWMVLSSVEKLSDDENNGTRLFITGFLLLVLAMTRIESLVFVVPLTGFIIFELWQSRVDD